MRAGLGEGGGHGWLLAQQIVHGEASHDTWVLDPRRFTGHADVELTALKAIEDYRNEFRFHFPHEHRPAGRAAKTTPLTHVPEDEGAEFAVVKGWERVDNIKPSPDFRHSLSFSFDETFGIIAAEVRNVQENVGLCEVSGFNRFEITGSDSHPFLDRMFCGNVTRHPGRVGLGYLLNHHGMVKSEATVTNLPESDRGPSRIWYGSAAPSECHDMDWLTQHIRRGEDLRIRSLTNDQTILVLAGLKARDVLSACSRDDWSKDSFPWLSVCECFIGFAPAMVMGICFSGELAYEIHVPNASLGRFVNPSKADFVGREALLERMAAGPRRRLATLKIDADHAPAQGGAPLMLNDEVVGTVTSGEWGHRVGMNLALAFVVPELAAEGSRMELDLCGELVGAEVMASSPYDPELSRVHS